jgi:heptosyltransferase-2
VLAPAGARNLLRDDILRRWPLGNYVALVALLIERGYSIHLAGGPGDQWASAAFAHLRVEDHIGKLSLVESLALFDTADLVVSHDTGPLHMAGLTRAALVALFGPTDPHVFLPARPNTIALWGGEGFACRPCHDGRNFAPCTQNGCLHQITPEFALEHIEDLLKARREGRSALPRIVTPETTPPLVILKA